MPKEPALDGSCHLHDATTLGSQRQSWKEGKVNSAEYYRTLTRGPATTFIGFRASEGQLKVRRLLQVDSCLNFIVQSCILGVRYLSSNSLSCDIFATLAQEIGTCPSCRLAVGAQCSCYWGLKSWQVLYFVGLLIKLLKRFWPWNNSSAYANVIHVMHETARPIRMQDIIGYHGNKAKPRPNSALWARNQLMS